eukprot:492226-Hanusia_phi.AAC.3
MANDKVFEVLEGHGLGDRSLQAQILRPAPSADSPLRKSDKKKRVNLDVEVRELGTKLFHRLLDLSLLKNPVAFTKISQKNVVLECLTH